MTPQAGHDDLVNGHEEAFLAYLMSAPDACDKFLHRVSEHILSVPHHRKVLAAIRDVYDERDKVNLLTVSDRLSDKRELEECGGRHGITVIATSTTSEEIAESALDAIVEDCHEREALKVGKQWVAGELTVDEVAAKLDEIRKPHETNADCPANGLRGTAAESPGSAALPASAGSPGGDNPHRHSRMSYQSAQSACPTQRPDRHARHRR